MSVINQRYDTSTYTGALINALEDKDHVMHELQDLKARDIIDSQQTMLNQMATSMNQIFGQQLQSMVIDINNFKSYINNLNQVDLASVFSQDNSIVFRGTDGDSNRYEIQYVGAFNNQDSFKLWCAQSENLPKNTNRIFVSWNITNGNYRIITNYRISDTVHIQAFRSYNNTANSSKEYRKITYSTENGITIATASNWVGYSNYSNISELTSTLVSTLDTYYGYAMQDTLTTKYDSMRTDETKEYLVYIGAFAAGNNVTGANHAKNFCEQYYNLSKKHSQTFIFYLNEYKQFLVIQHIPLSTTSFRQYFMNNGYAWTHGTSSVSSNQYGFMTCTWSEYLEVENITNGFDLETLKNGVPPVSIVDASTADAGLAFCNYPFITNNWGKTQLNLNTILNSSTDFSDLKTLVGDTSTADTIAYDVNALKTNVGDLDLSRVNNAVTEHSQAIASLFTLNGDVTKLKSNVNTINDIDSILTHTTNILYNDHKAQVLEFIGTYANSGTIENECKNIGILNLDVQLQAFIGYSNGNSGYISIMSYKLNDTTIIQNWRPLFSTNSTYRKLTLSIANSGSANGSMQTTVAVSWTSNTGSISELTADIISVFNNAYNYIKTDDMKAKYNDLKSHAPTTTTRYIMERFIHSCDIKFAGTFFSSGPLEDWTSLPNNIPLDRNRIVLGWSVSNNTLVRIISVVLSDTLVIQNWGLASTTEYNNYRKITISTDAYGKRVATVSSFTNNPSTISEITEDVISLINTYKEYVTSDIKQACHTIRKDDYKPQSVYAGAFKTKDQALTWCQQYGNLSKKHTQNIVCYLPDAEFITIHHVPLSETSFIQYQEVNGNILWHKSKKVALTNDEEQHVITWDDYKIDNQMNISDGFSVSELTTLLRFISITDSGTAAAALTVNNYPYMSIYWGKTQFNLNYLLSAATNFTSLVSRVEALETTVNGT